MAFDQATRRHILDTVDRFVRERVAPRAAEIDRTDEFPRDLWQAAAEAGLFALGIPEEYGGMGRDFVTPLLISERIARVSAAFALTFNNTTDSAVPIVARATEAIKAKYLPGLARGELIPCISFTEPEGGSDMAAMRTRAERAPGGYRITGRKMWCTNGVVGDVFTVFAKTDPDAGHRGITAFIVERGAEGFTIGRTESLIGLHGSPTTELIFEDVFVPAEARLGEEGEGFRIGVITLDESRLHCAATALGVATAALDHALSYARERTQFGKPVIEHQGLQFLVAECATELAAARALWERTTAMILECHDRRASTLAAMTKLICSDLSMKITTEAVQVMGAAGLSTAHPVERFMRDAKAFQIYDGTSQIQKSIIGRQLAKDGLPFDHLSVADHAIGTRQQQETSNGKR